ncbi:uncharacterized protein [Hetaerina americana]|uniref:uncharacterized protein n=1 Tax=Hetaerina americana TaxID=62018 RepID=UPI003A7F31AE
MVKGSAHEGAPGLQVPPPPEAQIPANEDQGGGIGCRRVRPQVPSAPPNAPPSAPPSPAPPASLLPAPPPGASLLSHLRPHLPSPFPPPHFLDVAKLLPGDDGKDGSTPSSLTSLYAPFLQHHHLEHHHHYAASLHPHCPLLPCACIRRSPAPPPSSSPRAAEAEAGAAAREEELPPQPGDDAGGEEEEEEDVEVEERAESGMGELTPRPVTPPAAHVI